MKRHPLDVLSLVFGLVFLLIAGLWAVRRSFDVDLPSAGFFLAGALVLAGVLGIVSAVRGPRNSRSVQLEAERGLGSTGTGNSAVHPGHTGGADTEPPRD